MFYINSQLFKKDWEMIWKMKGKDIGNYFFVAIESVKLTKSVNSLSNIAGDLLSYAHTIYC